MDNIKEIVRFEKKGWEVCAVCGHDIDDDPYQLIFEGGAFVVVCDTCGKNLVTLLEVEEKEGEIKIVKKRGTK